MAEEKQSSENAEETRDKDVLDQARELALEKDSKFNTLLLVGTAAFLAITVQATPPKSFGQVEILPAILLYLSWASGLLSLFFGFTRAEIDLAYKWNLFLALTLTQAERKAISEPIRKLGKRRSSAYPVQRVFVWLSLMLFAVFKVLTTLSF